MMLHRKLAIVAASAVLAAAVPTPSFGQDNWPSRTVTIIVPNDPGTGTDLGARLFAAAWSK